jgi:hypothetical protein
MIITVTSTQSAEDQGKLVVFERESLVKLHEIDITNSVKLKRLIIEKVSYNYLYKNTITKIECNKVFMASKIESDICHNRKWICQSLLRR